MNLRDPHLGDLVAALVDDELDAEGRDRALVHIAWCLPCRREVDEQRRAKARVAALDASDLVAPADLVLRLSAIPSLPAREAAGLVRTPIETPVPPLPRIGPHTRRPAALARRRMSAAVVGGASVLALGVWALPSSSDGPVGPGTQLVESGEPVPPYEIVQLSDFGPLGQLRQAPGYGFAGYP